jgi:tRNA (cytidine/uridine-2'-O-)-methyltransferase
VDIIEPCGFVLSDARFRRAGMDYLEMAAVTRHASWEAFRAQFDGRLLLLTSKGSDPYTGFSFRVGDTLLLGRESAGVPAAVHEAADARLRIPLKAGLRSLNVSQAGAMVLGEALRQTKGFP